jgi:hypothetical protein
MPIDLNEPGQARILSKWIADAIDDYCDRTYDDGHRNHLGASLIGHECSRYLWYNFRWVFHKRHGGRMQRLFNRGHNTEHRFAEWLRGIGFTVWTEDEDGKQFRVTDVGGHFGGSTDGQNAPPPALDLLQKILLCEFKTSGTGAGFNKLVEKGVAVAKPQHYRQMSIYGYKRGIEWAVYMCINKNDDSIHIEVVKLDFQLAQDLIRKAEAVITSQTPPPKCASSKTYFGCKFCDYAGICWEGQPLEINCRSCRFARPIADAGWQCDKYGVIPKEFIAKGCADHVPIS